MRHDLTKFITLSSFALILSACSATESVTEPVTQTATAAAETVNGADITAAPSGLYKSDPTHAYINMSYSHQGFSNPTIRWGKFEADVKLDAENVENSALTVVIDANSIDTGVAKFDDHLRGEKFFDVTNYPTITFVATDMTELSQGRGTVKGDLTIKDRTVPVELDVTLNKVGNHFRSGVDMFGVSATTQLTREEVGVNTYAQVAPIVDLGIEVEFWKVAD